MTPDGWAIIIGAIFVGLANLLQIYLASQKHDETMEQGRVNGAKLDTLHTAVRNAASLQMTGAGIASALQADRDEHPPPQPSPLPQKGIRR